ncbi:hypothetical protein N3K61_24305, partial [Escherichia coli]|uniref:hypothetical protein n=1 Tax=Escherichia coli TaxID=562 RepID=UPI0021BF8F6F
MSIGDFLVEASSSQTLMKGGIDAIILTTLLVTMIIWLYPTTFYSFSKFIMNNRMPRNPPFFLAILCPT